jgi:hypothetical protein
MGQLYTREESEHNYWSNSTKIKMGNAQTIGACCPASRRLCYRNSATVGRVAQVVELMPSKREAWTNISTTKIN